MKLSSRTFFRRTFLSGLVGFAAAVTLATACSNNTAPETPIKVGANVGNVPWEFEDESGQLVGFEVDLVNEIAERMDREVEFVNTPFTGLFPAVLSNRIDAAVSSITITEERMKTLDFAQPYYDSDQSLTVRADSGITSVADMRGKVVGVDTGSTGDTWAQQHMQQYGFKEIRRYEGLNPAMLDLEAGRFDGYISDIPATLYYTKDKTELEVVERIRTGERYSVMFAKDNPLRDEFNQVIGEMKKDDTLAEIHEKWFGSAPEDGTSTVDELPVPKL